MSEEHLRLAVCRLREEIAESICSEQISYDEGDVFMCRGEAKV